MSLFAKMEVAPADPILGLTDAFKQDSSPKKVNLGVGIYKDESGKTPLLESVRRAEAQIIAAARPEGYLPIEGLPAYNTEVQKLLFGTSSEVIRSGRVVTAQTPGGTGALRVAGDFLKAKLPKASVWVSDPTWVNHFQVFEAAGLNVKQYPYYDEQSKGVAFDKMLAALNGAPSGDVVLLHGCCHNPTGVDPTAEQWKAIANLMSKRGLLPFVDLAYQGFARSVVEDSACLHIMLEACGDLLVASSFSKNFGMYNQRLGALSIVAENASEAPAVLSHVKASIRANYSNPPAHGALIVSTVLASAELRALWEQEVEQMCDRLSDMRQLLVEKLAEKGAKQDFSYITEQKGMFSFSGLSKARVAELRERYSIYVVGSGRINVAGLTLKNIDYVAEAIVQVVS